MNKFEMGLGAPTTPEEQKIPKFTKEEWKKYFSSGRDIENDAELHNWMKEKGIKFDKGIIDVEIDGKKERMVTDKHDLGTCLLDDENETIESGFGKQ